MHTYPGHLIKAELVKRINRFVAEVMIDGEPESVYVPNTGRLSELALPGAELLLSEISGKYRYKILYIINESYPVMIDSTYSNKLFHDLLVNRKVPSFENCTLIRREPVYKNHRFDFLMKNSDNEFFIELKSCTLFHGTTASFPDAVSSRAAEHIKLLAETGKGVIVFFILKSGMEKFIPNYHTDFNFYETLRDNREKINVMALSVKYDEMLNIKEVSEVPVVIPDVTPRGLFIILLQKTILSGDIEQKNSGFSKNGYYLLCSSDKENVFKAVEKFRRSKTAFPPDLKIITDIPVISENLATSDAETVFINHGGKLIASAENSGEYNAVFFKDNPAETGWFWEEILRLRFG